MSTKTWSDEEKNFLIKNFPTNGSKFCSDNLDRTKRSCQEMAKKLDLKRVFKCDDVEAFSEIVKNSLSYTEVVIKLELSPRCSGNFQTIKKYIKKYNLDISHFINGFKSGNIPHSKKNLSEILIKDSFFSRKSLKERLYKEGLKKKECEICGIGENWFNGTKLVHILDHINGDPYDNRFENLRIVCPNCNSTLETNCGRNKVQKIYDPKSGKYKSEKTYKKCECGSVILKSSKMCSKCNGKRNRVVDRPSYEDLKKMVDEIGNTAVGKMYGVSESCIRKWIKTSRSKQV